VTTSGAITGSCWNDLYKTADANPFLLYNMLDPDDKSQWIIAPEAAEVVKRIFFLAIEGKCTMMIVNMFAADKVLHLYHYTRDVVNAANYDHSDPANGTAALLLLS